VDSLILCGTTLDNLWFFERKNSASGKTIINFKRVFKEKIPQESWLGRAELRLFLVPKDEAKQIIAKAAPSLKRNFHKN